MTARDYKTKRPARSTFSGWLGLACGLGLGLGIAAVIYLKDHRLDAPAAIEAARTARRKPHSNEPPEMAEPSDEPAKTYDFYDALPKFEMVVPEKDKDVRPDIKTVPETRKGVYVLQVGSYKNFSDADRVRAKLALQGVDAKVQKVSIDNDTWLRIRIGPISNLDELNRLRAILHKADVDALVIRVGD